MAIEKVFIDPESKTELRCWLNNRNEFYVELTDCEDRYDSKWLSLSVDEVNILIDHIKEELKKAK